MITENQLAEATKQTLTNLIHEYMSESLHQGIFATQAEDFNDQGVPIGQGVNLMIKDFLMYAEDKI